MSVFIVIGISTNFISEPINHYEVYRFVIVTWHKTADVIVDTPNPMHDDTPYTQQSGKCGEKGERIHLTTNYVTTLTEEQNIFQSGNPGIFKMD